MGSIGGELIMYENAFYIKNSYTGENTIIHVDIYGVKTNVPMDDANPHYTNMMKLVKEGKLTIAEKNPEVINEHP